MFGEGTPQDGTPEWLDHTQNPTQLSMISPEVPSAEWRKSVPEAATFHRVCSKRLLGRCEPDFSDLAELHMLLGLPEVVVVLHGKPTLRRTAKRLGKA